MQWFCVSDWDEDDSATDMEANIGALIITYTIFFGWFPYSN